MLDQASAVVLGDGGGDGAASTHLAVKGGGRQGRG